MYKLGLRNERFHIHRSGEERLLEQAHDFAAQRAPLRRGAFSKPLVYVIRDSADCERGHEIKYDYARLMSF